MNGIIGVEPMSSLSPTYCIFVFIDDAEYFIDYLDDVLIEKLQ